MNKKAEEVIEIKGLVRKFQCQKCGAFIQSEKYIVIPVAPEECREEEGGCGRKTKFYDVTFSKKIEATDIKCK